MNEGTRQMRVVSHAVEQDHVRFKVKWWGQVVVISQSVQSTPAKKSGQLGDGFMSSSASMLSGNQ